MDHTFCGWKMTRNQCPRPEHRRHVGGGLSTIDGDKSAMVVGDFRDFSDGYLDAIQIADMAHSDHFQSLSCI